MNRDIDSFLDAWTDDPKGVKPDFEAIAMAMAAVPGTRLELTARPGVSYSLRALHPGCAPRPLFALADVVEDPDGRWLSACFYADAVTDPEELGNTVPLGLLGEDGHCFDLDAPDHDLTVYVLERLREAAQRLA